jgi:hypothetical protein
MITPDTKDWTWVLNRVCPECGFDAQSMPREAIPVLLRENAAAWRPVLTGPADPRVRPRPDVWSPLEYACHVRDVCTIYLERLNLMLTQDNPHYPNWDQDQTAIDDRYREQDPHTVATDLHSAAAALAAAFAKVTAPQWLRPGSRGDGAHFTVESFARYFIHDPVHHLHDVTAG